MIQRRQRLLLRTRYAPNARTAMMMPAAIHWSPGFGKRLKLGIMAQRLYLGVPRCSSAVIPISSCHLVAKNGGGSSTRPNPAGAVAVDDGGRQGRLDIVLAENVEALALRVGKHMAI
jgi:hypothetical protein